MKEDLFNKAEATKPSIDNDFFTIGEETTIILDGNIEGLYHDVYYKMSGANGLIDGGVKDKTTWFVPNELSKNMPFKEVSNITIIVETYKDNSVYIGSTETIFKIKREITPPEFPSTSLDREIIVFDKFDVYFERPLKVIRNVSSAEITEELNGKFELQMSISHDDARDVIKADNYIQILGDIFKVVEANKKKDGKTVSVDILCEHVYFELLDDYIEEADRLTFYPDELVNFLNNYTRFNIEVDEKLLDRDKYPKRRITISRGSPIKTIIRMTEYWDLEIERFRRSVIIKPRVNEDKIQLFKIQKNLSSLEAKEISKATTTRLYLIGKEGLSVEGLNINDVPYRKRINGNKATFFNEDDIELGTIETRGSEITGRYIESKYIDAFPAQKNGEIVEGEIEDKLDLLLKGIEVLNENDESLKTYELSVQELFAHSGELERFGLGYKAILQDEDLLHDRESNLIESRITEYSYHPFDPNSDSKVIIGRKEEPLKLFKRMEEAASKVEENSDGWDETTEDVEELRSSSLSLLWDSNNSYIEVGRKEVEIASIEAESEKDSDGQGSLLVNFISNEEAEVSIRIYDNGVEELYSPIISKVHKGYNSIGIPHGYYTMKDGGHIFTVTAQSFGGNIAIQPRGVSYDIELMGPGIESLNLEIQDISMRNIKDSEDGKEIFILGYSEYGYPSLMKSKFENEKIYGLNDFTTVHDFKYLRDTKKIFLEFNGVFDREFGEERFTLYTQEEPWIFWINNKDEFWAQHGDNPRTAIMLDKDVIDASVVKGWSLHGSDNDMGLIAAYVNLEGEVKYRQLLGLININSQAKTNWAPSLTLSEAGSGNKGVHISRLNDYRVAFSVEGINMIFVSERLYVGQASPSEYVSFNPSIDEWMSIITVIPADEIPYELHPTSSSFNNKEFKLKARYKWNIRKNKSQALTILKNTSGVHIDNMYVDEEDPYTLIISMNKEVSSGELIIELDAEHIIGIHDNGTSINIDIPIKVFELNINAQEQVKFNLNLNSDIKVTDKDGDVTRINEYVNFYVNLDKNIEITKVEKNFYSNTENININYELSSNLTILQRGEIIS